MSARADAISELSDWCGEVARVVDKDEEDFTVQVEFEGGSGGWLPVTALCKPGVSGPADSAGKANAEVGAKMQYCRERQNHDNSGLVVADTAEKRARATSSNDC